MYTFTSNSENETMKFAYTFASKLHNGDVIVLSGDLGSGKTKFTEGFLSYFGLQDVYRLSSSDEFYAIGGEQYFDNGICIIEWGEIIKDALPKNYIHITFERNLENENKRILKIEAIGDKYVDLF